MDLFQPVDQHAHGAGLAGSFTPRQGAEPVDPLGLNGVQVLKQLSQIVAEGLRRILLHALDHPVGRSVARSVG